MKIISHRGNIDGKKSELENNPDHIKQLLISNYEIEIDVWFLKDRGYFLGHDEPTYQTNKKILKHKNLWCHAKNLDAVEQMAVDKIHYFWHENDKMTLTSRGIPWCFPGTFLNNGVTVMLRNDKPTQDVYGICTDYPSLFV